jgi:hypothetical protein
VSIKVQDSILYLTASNGLVRKQTVPSAEALSARTSLAVDLESGMVVETKSLTSSQLRLELVEAAELSLPKAIAPLQQDISLGVESVLRVGPRVGDVGSLVELGNLAAGVREREAGKGRDEWKEPLLAFDQRSDSVLGSEFYDTRLGKRHFAEVSFTELSQTASPGLGKVEVPALSATVEE